MNKLLSNPYVLGGIGGMIALLISYIEQKFFKKQKIDPQECIKMLLTVGTIVTVVVMLSQKKLPVKLLGGSSAAPTPTSTSAPAPAPVSAPTTGGGLQLSDINDAIHTGNPQF
jgi:hypothetical protein